MKHYGHFLPWAGRPVESKADDIVRLQLRRETLQNQLKQLENEIKDEETFFCDYVSVEWTAEEIKKAKEEAESYNNNARIRL